MTEILRAQNCHIRLINRVLRFR